MASQNSAYSAGAEKCSGNTLEQAEETKGKMQQAGLDVVLLLPAPAL